METYLTVAETAKYLKSSVRNIYHKIQESTIPYTRLDGKYLINKRLLDKLLKDNTVLPKSG